MQNDNNIEIHAPFIRIKTTVRNFLYFFVKVLVAIFVFILLSWLLVLFSFIITGVPFLKLIGLKF